MYYEKHDKTLHENNPRIHKINNMRDKCRSILFVMFIEKFYVKTSQSIRDKGS